MKKFLTNLLIGLAAIQVKSEEEQISLLLEGFYDSLCSVSQLLYLLSQNQVLNAFRHHWNLHACCFSSGEALAVVLNAFRHHWNLHTAGQRTEGCEVSAQRLSASLESSLRRSAEDRQAAAVLNAFRHHWNLHIEGVADDDARFACSTPFGIIGIFTLNHWVSSLRVCAVLNAFRHHWNLHSAGACLWTTRLMCSTPFGIIGIFTR